ncbi:MAG: hypothetical protein IJ454_05090 [Clostridia bacterium]|nr:hypothetical protein [Clostridia bacterium]
MENEKFTENEINILDMLLILKKHIVKIAAAAVIVAILALLYTNFMVVPMYRSTTQMLIKGLNPEAMTIYPDSTSRIMLVNNSIEILGGTEVMLDVIDELSLEMTPEMLQSCVSISSPVDTQVLKISVVHPDPVTAKDIASKLSEIAHSALAENVGVSALSTIEKAKTPTAPVSPNPLKNMVLGGFLGAVMSSAWFILVRFVNNKIYTPEDAERALGLTVFSSIPLVVSEDIEIKKAAAKKSKEE